MQSYKLNLSYLPNKVVRFDLQAKINYMCLNLSTPLIYFYKQTHD